MHRYVTIYSHPSWTKPGGGMEREKTALLVWKSLTNLSATTWGDLEMIVFKQPPVPRYFEGGAHGDLNKVPIAQRSDLHPESVMELCCGN